MIPIPLLTISINDAHGLDHCSREVLKKVEKQGYWSPDRKEGNFNIIGTGTIT